MSVADLDDDAIAAELIEAWSAVMTCGTASFRSDTTAVTTKNHPRQTRTGGVPYYWL
jgi:hypothetical protein